MLAISCKINSNQLDKINKEFELLQKKILKNYLTKKIFVYDLTLKWKNTPYKMPQKV